MQRAAFVILGLLLVPGAGSAQQQYLKYSAGTGFFINRAGHVITNAHVVRGCKEISLHTSSGELPARLVAHDDERDLAVLKTTTTTAHDIAPLRWNIADLREGADLWLYGFPGEAGARGTPNFTRTKLVAMRGPTGEPQWLQLKTTAQHGNSGGPVLDASANVIAVIAGIAETYRPATRPGETMTLIGKTDVAITLASLQDFLRQHQIPFYEAASGMVAYAEPIIARNASRYVFPVRCLQGVITQ
jgi:serine protease Do